MNFQNDVTADLDRALAGTLRPNGVILNFVTARQHSAPAMAAAASRMFGFNPECACALAAFAWFQAPGLEAFVADLHARHDLACDRSTYLDLLRTGGIPALRDYRLAEYRRGMLAGDLEGADRHWQRFHAIAGSTFAPSPDLQEARELTRAGLARTVAGAVVPRTWEQFEDRWDGAEIDVYKKDGYLDQHPSKAAYVEAVVTAHGGRADVAVVDFGWRVERCHCGSTAAGGGRHRRRCH